MVLLSVGMGRTGEYSIPAGWMANGWVAGTVVARTLALGGTPTAAACELPSLRLEHQLKRCRKQQ